MKQPLSLLVAAVAATACAPAVPAGEFRIVGKIENVPDGAVVRLYEPQGQMLRGIGVDTLAGGRFSFRDTVAFPKVVQISVTVGDYRGGTLDVWVAPGKRIEVRGEDKQAWLWEAASDIAEQADEDMYRALVEPQICELNWFQDMLNTQQDFARYMELFGQVSEKTVRRMQTAPVTRVWLNKLAECARLLQFGIGTAHKAEMLALYDRMTEEQRQSPMGRRIDAYLNPAPAEPETGWWTAICTMRMGICIAWRDSSGNIFCSISGVRAAVRAYRRFPNCKRSHESMPAGLRL